MRKLKGATFEICFGNVLWLFSVAAACFSSWGWAEANGLRLGAGSSIFSMSPGGELPIVLTLTNEDLPPIDLVTAEVLVIAQGSGATGDAGSISIESAVSVEDALFDLPEPLVFPWLGATFIQTAGLLSPSTLGSSETRPLFQLNLHASPDARGTHLLLMRPFDLEDANSSGVIAFQEDLIRIPYANEGSAEFSNLVVIATIEITAPPSGDYDGNGVVDANDYGVWKESFGQSVETPGIAADGNEDGIINLADYAVWRDNLGVGVAPAVVLPSAQVPEAPACNLALLACVVGFLTGSEIRRRNSYKVIGRDGRQE